MIALHKRSGDKGRLVNKAMMIFVGLCGGVENLRMFFIIDNLCIAIDDKVSKIMMSCPPPRALQRSV